MKTRGVVAAACVAVLLGGCGTTPVQSQEGLVVAAAVVPTRLRRLGTANAIGSAERDEPRPGRALRLAVTGATIATGVAGFASIALVAVIPRIIYAGYLGWGDLPGLLEVWVRAPALLLISTVALAVLVASYWRRGWWADPQRWTRGAFVAAAIVVTTMLVSWRMIGVA